MQAKSLVALLACGWAGAAAAANADTYDIPYFGALGTYVMTDSSRGEDDGLGYQLTFGVPLAWENLAFELTFFDNNMEREIDGEHDYQTGLLLDGVYDFGTFGWHESLPTFKPFLLAGWAAVQEDVQGDKHLHAGVNAGLGALFSIPYVGQWVPGWALRVEARALGQLNDKTVADEDLLADYRFSVGVQIPLTMFYDRTVPVAPAVPCDVAVIDPATGRTDCATDNDRDGVLDPNDRCPGTPLGTAVDQYGCAVQSAAMSFDDSDRDGVGDTADECADTTAGLTVDVKGCAVAQDLLLPGVGFRDNSADLTEAAKRTLDGVARTLLAQANLRLEVGGHTDSSGEAAHNLTLSQHRADSVKSYLVGKGVDAGRLNAIGYGEERPLAANDTADGRASNRRVEFTIVVTEKG
jgi:OmpA-OmpF porin, OOP family